MQKQEMSEDGMWPAARGQQYINHMEREACPKLCSPSSFLPSRIHLVERWGKTHGGMFLILPMELNSLAQD